MNRIAVLTLSLLACTGEPTAPEQPPKPVEGPAPVAPAPAPSGPGPALFIGQAQFTMKDGGPVPGPAKLVIVRGETNAPEIIEDPESNVFHKVIPWRDGLLTIGAEAAKLKHWKKENGAWKATTLWERSWGGKFDRFRDLEIGDVNGDGKDEIVLATHDMGVVAVGTESDQGWTFVEVDAKPDTFVHEIEIGDVDHDGKTEFYCTPSDRNRASGVSQAGGVRRYDWNGQTYAKTDVVQWAESHAKEILVADVDGDGAKELYVAREAHTEKKDGKTVIVTPVIISRLVPGGAGYAEQKVAELDDKQCRFLVAGDVDHDGKSDLVAAGMDSGLWLLRLQMDGTFAKENLDKNTGGFEHATHLADLDKDGKLEIYVADDRNQRLKSYAWNDGQFDRKKLWKIPDNHITWTISDGIL